MPTIITGIFPLRPTGTGGFSATTWSNKNMLQGHSVLSESQIINGAVGSDIQQLINQHSSLYTVGHRPFGKLGPYWCVFSGTPNFKFPTRFVELYPKVKTNTGKVWRERFKTDAIIVTNLKRGNLRFDYNNGYTAEELGPVYPRGEYVSPEELYPLVQTKYGPVLQVGARQYDNNFSVSIATQQLRLTEQQDPYYYGWVDSDFEHLFRTSLENLPIDYGMVTSVLAEANSGTLDLLTSMAEMPETVKSIYNALKQCITMYRDARQRAFRLYDKVKKGENQSVKTTKDTLDAISDVWMNYRYNIMPNVYLIEDAYTTLTTSLATFLRFRDTDSDIPMELGDLHGFAASGKFTVTQRCLIKRAVTLAAELPRLKHLMLTNLAVTAWELTPLSFVLDWFVNVGNCLAALFVNPSFDKEGSTFSWQISGGMTYTHESGANVTIDARAYRRLVIDPRKAVSLTFKPELNWKRELDALALSWGIFIKKML